MGVEHLLNLRLVLAFKSLHDGFLSVLRLLLVLVASFLELLNCQFKLLLRFNQVALVVVFLGFQEHDFALPERLVTIVIALQILELPLSLL